MGTKHLLKPLIAGLALLPAVSFAAVQGSLATPPDKKGNNERLEVGLGVGFWDSSYRSYDEDTLVVPLIFYSGEYFYVEGAQAGYKLYEEGHHRIGIMVDVDSQEWDAGDSDAFPEFDDRDRSIGVGAAYKFQASWGVFNAKMAFDVTDESDGMWSEVSFSYPWRVTEDIMIMPGAFVKYMSSDYTEYYYGISRKEANRVSGVDRYNPGDGANYGLNILAAYNFMEDWKLMAGAKMTKLGKDIEDSPMMDDSMEWKGFFGVTYRFW